MKFSGAAVLCLWLAMAFGPAAFAAEGAPAEGSVEAGWRYDDTGWWYEYSDRTWPHDCWLWVDGNNDGTAECYYFKSNGYICMSEYVNGLQVNDTGAWVRNGEVQLRKDSEYSNIAIQGSRQSDKSKELKFPDEGSSAGDALNSDTEEYPMRAVNLINDICVKKGREQLQWDQDLADCAAIRAKELPKLFGHRRPDGDSCFELLIEKNLSFRFASENIAKGPVSPEELMEQWRTDSEFESNLAKTGLTKAGLAFYDEGGERYWVLFMAN